MRPKKNKHYQQEDKERAFKKSLRRSGIILWLMLASAAVCALAISTGHPHLAVAAFFLTAILAGVLTFCIIHTDRTNPSTWTPVDGF